MKKLVLFFALIGLVSLTASAQTKTCSKAEKAACAKTCAKKAAMTKTVSSESMTAASRAASLDVNIEEKVCAKSGTVSFVKKNVCAKSGTVSFADVKYCNESQAFVNVSPSKTAKAVKTGTATKKAACAKTCAKTCSKSKAAKAKLTKAEK